ncbi:MAG: hypothetical protein QNJ30_20980 [Kiloniellales bacterium]|nr:hypothetical protein [Kiloniellales bacterium]
MRRLFVFGAVLAVCVLYGETVLSQQLLSVSFKNVSYNSVHLTINDDVCKRLVFQRRLANAATTRLRFCADRRGRAQVSVYDYRGRRYTFSNVIDGRTISLPVR